MLKIISKKNTGVFIFDYINRNIIFSVVKIRDKCYDSFCNMLDRTEVEQIGVDSNSGVGFYQIFGKRGRGG